MDRRRDRKSAQLIRQDALESVITIGWNAHAKGIIADRDAVQAAIIQLWSNGQTEDQLTKLKLVKRQMYGRAKIDLLEAPSSVPRKQLQKK
jgi:transposase